MEKKIVLTVENDSVKASLNKATLGNILNCISALVEGVMRCGDNNDLDRREIECYIDEAVNNGIQRFERSGAS